MTPVSRPGNDAGFVCCPPDEQSPYGYCLHAGDACFT